MSDCPLSFRKDDRSRSRMYSELFLRKFHDYSSETDLSEWSKLALSRLSKKTEGMSLESMRVMLALLYVQETSGAPCEFWNNPYRDGVSICSRTLCRFSAIDESRLEQSIGPLKNKKMIEGGPLHWRIIPSDWRDKIRSTASRRKQIPSSIRIIVLAVGKCGHCGAMTNLSVDHVVPVKKGGTDDLHNLQCLCRSCNSRKRDRFIG